MQSLAEALTYLAALGTGGVLGSWLNEWRRAHREDKLRWLGERRATYERYITAVDNLRVAEVDAAEYVAQLREITGWHNDPLFDVEDLLQRAQQVDDPWTKYATAQVRALKHTTDAGTEQVGAALAAIEIIASPDVVHAAIKLDATLSAMVAVAEQYPPRKCGGWSEPLVEASRNVSEAREAFIQSVRTDLNVT